MALTLFDHSLHPEELNSTPASYLNKKHPSKIAHMRLTRTQQKRRVGNFALIRSLGIFEERMSLATARFKQMGP